MPQHSHETEFRFPLPVDPASDPRPAKSEWPRVEDVLFAVSQSQNVSVQRIVLAPLAVTPSSFKLATHVPAASNDAAEDKA